MAGKQHRLTSKFSSVQVLLDKTVNPHVHHDDLVVAHADIGAGKIPFTDLLEVAGKDRLTKCGTCCILCCHDDCQTLLCWLGLCFSPNKKELAELHKKAIQKRKDINSSVKQTISLRNLKAIDSHHQATP
jgi:hypothetical protein